MRRPVLMVALLLVAGCAEADPPLSTRGGFTLRSCEQVAGGLEIKARVSNDGHGMASYSATVGLYDSDDQRVGSTTFNSQNVPAGRHVDGVTLAATDVRHLTCRIDTVSRHPVTVIRR